MGKSPLKWFTFSQSWFPQWSLSIDLSILDSSNSLTLNNPTGKKKTSIHLIFCRVCPFTLNGVHPSAEWLNHLGPCLGLTTRSITHAVAHRAHRRTLCRPSNNLWSTTKSGQTAAGSRHGGDPPIFGAALVLTQRDLSDRTTIYPLVI